MCRTLLTNARYCVQDLIVITRRNPNIHRYAEDCIKGDGYIIPIQINWSMTRLALLAACVARCKPKCRARSACQRARIERAEVSNARGAECRCITFGRGECVESRSGPA